jgi:glycosyltransferase involved in cell wall biosynthesis
MTAADALPRTRVLLLTEGTYPHHWGGVSTWADLLVRQLDDVDFVVMALTDDPAAPVRFALPPNVVDLVTIPLWGVRDAWEVRRTPPVRAAGRRAIRASFLPAYEELLAHLLTEARPVLALGDALVALHGFFVEHDLDAALRSRAAWEALEEAARRDYPGLALAHGYPDAEATPRDLVDAARWIRHWLFPLADELPRVDVAHASMAGLCSAVACVAKLRHGARFVLSEHGVHLREAYLADAPRAYSLFSKLLRLRLARATTGLAYVLADVIAPCCAHNTRWERRLGVLPSRLQTAYYGIAGVEADDAPVRRRAHVVAWAGRIDPLKDVETLLRAAARVHAAAPDVTFDLAGGVPSGDEAYAARCSRLQQELDLGDAVHFLGHRPDAVDVLAQADLVVLTSVSEGFPFVTLEAMAHGRPIVATDVGGMREQLGEAGVLVPPGDADALAEAVIGLLDDRERRAHLSAEAARRAREAFSLARFRAVHHGLYRPVLFEEPRRVA